MVGGRVTFRPETRSTSSEQAVGRAGRAGNMMLEARLLLFTAAALCYDVVSMTD